MTSQSYEPKVLEILGKIQSDYPRVQVEKIEELTALDPSLKIFSRLVDIYNSEYSARIPEMRIACGAGHLEALLEITHRFKSTAYNLGAARAAELMTAIEKVVREKPQSHHELLIMIAALENECQLASIELTNILI